MQNKLPTTITFVNVDGNNMTCFLGGKRQTITISSQVPSTFSLSTLFFNQLEGDVTKLLCNHDYRVESLVTSRN